MAEVELIGGASDEQVAAWLHRRLADALERTAAPIAICLPGGSTPVPILKHLAGSPLDWRRITVWPGDDRIVPANHPASNAGQLRTLLEPLGAEVVTLTIMEEVPRFALTWLGMGADGHIASLFPNTDPNPSDPQRIRQITPDPLPPEAPFDRVTLTIPALLNADEVLFVIRGQEKQALFEAAMMGEGDWPVTRLLEAATQKVTCFA
jgi:6-phosphogluconolactonase